MTDSESDDLLPETDESPRLNFFQTWSSSGLTFNALRYGGTYHGFAEIRAKNYRVDDRSDEDS
jgi:hypothetical protein